MNVHKGNEFLLATYNPIQLQPIRGRPFLVPPCVIPCYKIIPIKNSVRAQDDNFFRIHQIARKFYKELIENSQLIDGFERLCGGFMFVDLLYDPEITPETFRIYAKNFPAEEASRNLIYSVKIIHSKTNINQRKSIDLEW